MKISELTAKLQKLKDEYGDVEVGVINDEFYCFDPIVEMGIKERNRRESLFLNNDDEELGDIFVGIS